MTETYRQLAEQSGHILEIQRLWGKELPKPEFPVDPDDPYYSESPARAILALETNTPTYFDAVNLPNHGAVDNLPAEVILDIPAVAVGGEIRPIHAGALPPGPLEICRRQTVQHEMLARACHHGDAALVEQTLCLAPYVRSITQARRIWDAYWNEYRSELPSFA